MEEDIKILEEFIEEYNASYPEEKEWVVIYPNQVKAIENLIARNKDLENKDKSLKKEIGLMKSVNINDNFISKSKVKEKMQEIIKLSENETAFMTQSSQINAVLINFCRELLED